MVRYASSVHVDREPADVFEYLIEPAKQALWSDVEMRLLTTGPLGNGSRMEVMFGMGPLKANAVLELTAVEPGVQMSFRTIGGSIDWSGTYRLAAAPSGGTDLSQSGTLLFRGLWKLLEPIVGAEISRAEVKELEKLKAAAEAA